MKTVSIIDYGMSNLLSICRAFEHVGAEVKVIDKPDDILKSDYLVLPGVGAFPDGMNHLNDRQFSDVIQEFAKNGKPFLGICLGMQMMMSKGFEHKETKGLNIIQGDVLALPKDMPTFKVPNINWHSVYQTESKNWNNSIMQSTQEGSCFYFVHSYYAKPENADNILTLSSFGDLKYASAIRKDNVCGTQFHPEKSGVDGLKLLENFLLQ